MSVRSMSRSGFLTVTGGVCAAAIGATGSRAPAVGRLDGVALFPSNNPWNIRVDKMPVDPQSDQIIANYGKQSPIVEIGMPFNIVSGNQPKIPIRFGVPGESDPGPYPISANPRIENGSYSRSPSSDHHLLILDTGEQKLYEMYDARLTGSGWYADSGAVFDLTSNRLRPNYWTSSDAAGLPVIPGLVRYDEVLSGQIAHALRFTLSQTRQAFVHPATHLTYSGPKGPGWAPMGARFRLKASVDISRFSRPLQVILLALQRYGMMVADNGTPYGITGDDDWRWVASGIAPYSAGFRFDDSNGMSLTSGHFEVVKMGHMYFP